MSREEKIEAIRAIASGKSINEVFPVNDILVIGKSEGIKIMVLADMGSLTIAENELTTTIERIKRKYPLAYARVIPITWAEYYKIDAGLEAEC